MERDGECANGLAYNDTYVSCEARLNEDSFVDDPTFYTNAEVEVIAMHEMGHCFSLYHAPDVASIMGASARGDFPNADNIDLINARCGTQP